MKFLQRRRRQRQPFSHRRTRRSGASWARTSPCTSATCLTPRTSTERCSVRREFNSSVTARRRIDGVTVATRRRLTPSPRRRERHKEHATHRSKRRFWVSKDNAPQGPSNEAENVYLDSHIYACFVDDLKAMTPQQHIRQVCKFERDHIVQTCA